jgi:hypothetical protein
MAGPLLSFLRLFGLFGTSIVAGFVIGSLENHGWASSKSASHSIKCMPGETVDFDERVGRWICCKNPVEVDGILSCARSYGPKFTPGTNRAAEPLAPYIQKHRLTIA